VPAKIAAHRAGTGSNLEEDVAVVVRVFGDQQTLQLSSSAATRAVSW